MYLKAGTLASRLLVHTRMAHAAAEHSPFVDGSVSGWLPLAACADYQLAQRWA